MENVSNHDDLFQIGSSKPIADESIDEKQETLSREVLETQDSRGHLLDQIREEHRLALDELNKKLSQANEELLQSRQHLTELERELAISKEKTCLEREYNVSDTLVWKKKKTRRQRRNND
jgi:vacuolar-type H+-ATPase subunit H